MNKGYAYEASIAVLQKLLDSPEHECILATVVEKNIKSIRLLEKLGLQKIDTIEVGNHDYLLYRIDKL
jgi:RimJ/RimL family protein N-acetyltransferase